MQKMLSNSPFSQIIAFLFLFGQFFNFANAFPTSTSSPSTIFSLFNSSKTAVDLTGDYSVAAFWEAKNCFNQTEDDPMAQSYFWSIHDPLLMNGTNGDGKLVGYLFGIIKMPANLIWNSILPEILVKIEIADELILETDESDSVGFIKKCFQFLHSDPPLSDEMAKRLEKYLAKHEVEMQSDLPEWNLFKLQHWKEMPPQWILTALQLVQIYREMRELNGELRQMMDQKLANLAEEYGTSVGYLEKFRAKGDDNDDEMCQLFPSLRERKNLMEFAIGHFIDELEMMEAEEGNGTSGQFWDGQVQRIIDHYNCGILQRNDELLAINTQNTTKMNLIEQMNSLMAEDLFQRRNRKMAPIIQQRLRQNPQKLQFFAIGAVNLIGIGNLVELLKKEGFQLHEQFMPPTNAYSLPNDNQSEELEAVMMATARGLMPQEFGRIGNGKFQFSVILIVVILFVFGCIFVIFSLFFYYRSRTKFGDHSLVSAETGKPDLRSVKSNSPPPTISIITNNKLLVPNLQQQNTKQQNGNKNQHSIEMQQTTSPFQRNLTVKKSPPGYTQPPLTVQQFTASTSHQNLAFIDSATPSPAPSQQNVQCEQKTTTEHQPQQKVTDPNEIGGGKEGRISNIYSTYTPKYGRSIQQQQKEKEPNPIHLFDQFESQIRQCNQTQIAKSTFLQTEQPKLMKENAWNTNSGTFSPLAIGKVSSESNHPALAQPQVLYRGKEDLQKQQSAAEAEEAGMEESSQFAVENEQKKPTIPSHILQVGIDFEPILESAEEEKEQQTGANTFGSNELEEKKKEESEEVTNGDRKDDAEIHTIKTATTVSIECHENEAIQEEQRQPAKDNLHQVGEDEAKLQSSKSENGIVEDEEDGSVIV